MSLHVDIRKRLGDFVLDAAVVASGFESFGYNGVYTCLLTLGCKAGG